MRNLFRLEDDPFGMSRRTKPPDPPGAFCYDFFVGTMQFMVIFGFGADEQSLYVDDVRFVGDA